MIFRLFIQQKEEEIVTLVFLGDISFDGVTRYHVTKGNCTYSESFEKMKPVLKEKDYAIGNLESPLGGEFRALNMQKSINMYAEKESFNSLR